MRVRATVKVCHLETKKKTIERTIEKDKRRKRTEQNIERQVREIRRRTVHIVLADIHKNR